MATKDEVKKFLRDFKQKSKICKIFYSDDRGKNQQTLFDLDIPPSYRDKVLHSIIYKF